MNDKNVILISSMLTNPMTGMHTVWTWYSDGSMDERQVPLSAPVVLTNIKWVS